MTLLVVEGLTKVFEPGKTAVASVDLAIEEGEIVCLLGPSGCGKTTLLRLIAGLEHPNAGDVWFNGRSIFNVPPHQRGFGMMFQDFALFPHKNVADNIAFGLEMQDYGRAQIGERVDEMLTLVDLAGYGERDIGRLSGGEQQRVALARSLAPDPKLLMLDEPLGALDRALRERLMLDLREILKRVGVTAVYVTHDQTEAFAIADRIAVMNAGCIEQLDKPETIYYLPATPFVARFLGFRNLLPGTVKDAEHVETSLGLLRIQSPLPLEGTDVTVLIRPDRARVASIDGLLHENGIVGVVTAVSFRGKYYQVWLNAGKQTLMFEMNSAEGFLSGQQIALQLRPDATSIFSS